MADHDLIAELTGYRNELEGLLQQGKTGRAEQVRPLLAEVERQVRAKGASLRRAACATHEAGQDAVAERLHAEADRWETAAGPEPVMERAVPAKPSGRKGSEV